MSKAQTIQPAGTDVILTLPAADFEYFIPVAKRSVFASLKADEDEISSDAVYKLYEYVRQGRVEKVPEGYWAEVNGQTNITCRYGVRNQAGKLAPVTLWLARVVINQCKSALEKRETDPLWQGKGIDIQDRDVEDRVHLSAGGTSNVDTEAKIWQLIDQYWPEDEQRVYEHFCTKHYPKQSVKLSSNSPCSNVPQAIARFCRRWVEKKYRSGISKIGQDQLLEELGINGARKGTFSGYVKDYGKCLENLLRHRLLDAGIDLEETRVLLIIP